MPDKNPKEIEPCGVTPETDPGHARRARLEQAIAIDAELRRTYGADSLMVRAFREFAGLRPAQKQATKNACVLKDSGR